MKSSFNMQLQGFTAANRDAVVKITHEATGTVTERKPFLDGSLVVRDLEPGFYEVEVTHPNLNFPIDRRRVRLFPQPAPTRITIPVPEDLFRDTPIRDIPDADLSPVQQTATDARARLAPLAAKAPGEVIRAADWNQLVGAMADLAGAVLELSKLVTPRGHDHAEIAEKIAEGQENLRRFAEAYGRSLLELKRELEVRTLDQNVNGVLDAAGASAERRERLLTRVNELQGLVQSDTQTFTGKTAAAGLLLLNEINAMAVEQGDAADQFLARDDVRKVNAMARQYADAGAQTRAESELLTYERTSAAIGGTKFRDALGR